MRQDYMLRAYKASIGMEPVALLDDYVKIITNASVHFRKVTFYEAIPPFQWIDFAAATPNGPLAVAAAIAAATTAPKADVTRLDLYTDEFGQWRWFPLDDMQVQLFLPSGASKWQLKNLQVGLDRNIIYRDPTLITTEFNSWEDNRPAMQATNGNSVYTLTRARIIGWGFRFHTTSVFGDDKIRNPVDGLTEQQRILAGLQKGAIPYTPIQCAGLMGQAGRSS